MSFTFELTFGQCVKEWDAFRVPSLFSTAEWWHKFSMTIGLSSSEHSSEWRRYKKRQGRTGRSGKGETSQKGCAMMMAMEEC